MISDRNVYKTVSSFLKLEPSLERIALLDSDVPNIADSCKDTIIFLVQDSRLPFLERCKKASSLYPFSNSNILVYTLQEVREKPFVQNNIECGRLFYEGNYREAEKRVSATGEWWAKELWIREMSLEGVKFEEIDTIFQTLAKIFTAEWTKRQIEKTPKFEFFGKVSGINLREAHPFLRLIMPKGSIPFISLCSIEKQIQAFEKKGLFSGAMKNRLLKGDTGIFSEIKFLSYLSDKCEIAPLEEIQDGKKKPECLVQLERERAYCEIKSLDLFQIDRIYEALRMYFFDRRDELFKASGEMLSKFILKPRIVYIFKKKFKCEENKLFEDVINFIKNCYDNKCYKEISYANTIDIQLLPPERVENHELFSKELEWDKYRDKILRVLKTKVRGKFEYKSKEHSPSLNLLIFFTDPVLSIETIGDNILKYAKEKCNISGIFFISSFMKDINGKRGIFNEIEFIPVSDKTILENNSLVKYICDYKKVI